LAMLSAVFHPDDRSRAIGAWSGLSTVSTAVGPFLGGWLIDAVSWRWVFLINPAFIIAAVWIVQRYTPETRGEQLDRRIDVPGAVSLSIGLAGVVYALIEGPPSGWTTVPMAAGVIGVVSLVGFALIEWRSPVPMVPLDLFKSKVFAGTNAATFAVWGAIGAVFFLLTLRVQNDLGYSALEAGAATLPITVMMMLFAARSGQLAQRIGPRAQMIGGPLVIAAGFLLMSHIGSGSRYVSSVLPAVLLFALGLVITVAPLTATVLGAVADQYAGVGSAINNAVARVASLLAIAVLPALAGIVTSEGGSLGNGYSRAMWICAALCVVGSAICALTISNEPQRSEANPPAAPTH
jgi:MFS family permease